MARKYIYYGFVQKSDYPIPIVKQQCLFIEGNGWIHNYGIHGNSYKRHVLDSFVCDVNVSSQYIGWIVKFLSDWPLHDIEIGKINRMLATVGCGSFVTHNLEHNQKEPPNNKEAIEIIDKALSELSIGG